MNYNKIYYEKNKEHIKQLVRDRYKNKKEEINKKITCPDCGRIVIGRMYKKHLNTTIHKKGYIIPDKNKNKINKINDYNSHNLIPKFPENNGWIHFI